MAFRFWVDDFEGGTSYMSNEEVGCYLRLLLYQFRNGVIPKEIFARISRGLTAVEPVLSKFDVVDGGYVQHRMAEIRQESIDYAEKQSIKGKKSAELRFNRGSTTVQPHGSGSGSGKEEKDKKKGVVGEKGKGNDLEAEFPRFSEIWEAYGLKVGKKAAENAYRRLTANDRHAAYTKIPLYIKSLSDRKFQAHLSTWLNGRRWEDEYPPVAINGKNEGHHQNTVVQPTRHKTLRNGVWGYWDDAESKYDLPFKP